jgi:hypothetical protein
MNFDIFSSIVPILTNIALIFGFTILLSLYLLPLSGFATSDKEWIFGTHFIYWFLIPFSCYYLCHISSFCAFDTELEEHDNFRIICIILSKPKSFLPKLQYFLHKTAKNKKKKKLFVWLFFFVAFFLV